MLPITRALVGQRNCRIMSTAQFTAISWVGEGRGEANFSDFHQNGGYDDATFQPGIPLYINEIGTILFHHVMRKQQTNFHS